MNKQIPELNATIARKVLETVDHGLVCGLGIPKPGEMCIEAAVCYAYGIPHSDNPPCVGAAVRSYKINLNDATWSSPKARAEGMRAIAIAQLDSNILNQQEFAKKIAEKTIKQIIPKILRTLAGMIIFAAHATNLNSAADNCEILGTQKAAEDAAWAAAWAAWAAAGAAEAAARAARDAARDAARAAAWAAAWAAAGAAEAAARAARDAAGAAAWAAAWAAWDAAGAAARDAAWDAGDKYLSIGSDICLEVLKEMNSPGCEYLYLLDKNS